jgi:polygalacturonase
MNRFPLTRLSLALLITGAFFGLSAAPLSARVFNVRDFGAKGDGKTPDTAAIDQAIASCAAAGGGTVLFPEGVYLAGTIHLKGDNLTLELTPKARILGRPNDENAYDPAEPNEWEQYQDNGHSHFHNALLWGTKLKNFSITGGGSIHGGGIVWGNKVQAGGGDKILSLTECKGIKVTNVSLLQGGHFVMLLNDCDDIEVSKVLIRTPRDGLDFMGCRNILVEDCVIRCYEHPDYDRDLRPGEKLYAGDDCIGIKSDYALGRRLDTENVVVRRCKLTSGCNPIQFGSETTGNFRNCHFTDIEIDHADKAGLGLTSNDGGTIEDVTFKNITIAKAAVPIYINVNPRRRTPEKVTPGRIRNVSFENIVVTDSYGYGRKTENASVISGMPGFLVENIVFKNIKISAKGGGKKAEADLVPHYPVDYSPGALGRRPAYGFYIRHAKNIEFQNADFAFENDDGRPAIVCQDVDGIILQDVTGQRGNGVDHDVVLRKTTGLKVAGKPLTAVERTAPDPQPQESRQKRGGNRASKEDSSD